MKNLKLALPFFKLCISNTSDVLKNLYTFTEETRYKKYAKKKYHLNDGLAMINVLDLLPAFHEKVDHYSFLEGTSNVIDLALLKGLAKRFDNAQFLEFGTWRGESIVNMASICEKCVSVSFSEEEMRRIGISENSIKATRFFSRNDEKIKHIQHNTQTYNYSELEEKFDLVFVDADHKYEGVKIDTQNAFKLLKNEKSIIVWHDAGFQTENTNWQVTAAILDGAPSDVHRKKIFRVSNTLCAIYIQDNYKPYHRVKSIPDKEFVVEISGKSLQPSQKKITIDVMRA